MKDFIRARTAEQIAERRNEIVNACEQIYMAGGFDAVTFKAISERTSFTRPSIYNYYATKEEVMLDLFERYFVKWYGEIFAGTDSVSSLTAGALCRIITDVSDRYQNLFMMFSDLRNIEEGCRVERIAVFKKRYLDFNDRMEALIARRFPGTSAESARCFIEGILVLFHALKGLALVAVTVDGGHGVEVVAFRLERYVLVGDPRGNDVAGIVHVNRPCAAGV